MTSPSGFSKAEAILATNLTGATPPEEIIGGVERGLYVTDLIGFGVNVVTGDYSQGAVGHWIEKGRLTHPVHEVTIAGNLKEMLKDVDAVGNEREARLANARGRVITVPSGSRTTASTAK